MDSYKMAMEEIRKGILSLSFSERMVVGGFLTTTFDDLVTKYNIPVAPIKTHSVAIDPNKTDYKSALQELKLKTQTNKYKKQIAEKFNGLMAKYNLTERL